MRELLLFAGLKPPEGALIAVAIHVDWLDTLPGEEARQLVQLGVMRRAESLFDKRLFAMLEYGGELLALVADMDVSALETQLLSLSAQVKAELGFSVTAGVGPKADAQKIHLSRRGALLALERRFAQGCDAVYSAACPADAAEDLSARPPEIMRALSAAIGLHDVASATRAVRDIGAWIAARGAPRQFASATAIEAALTIWQAALANGMIPPPAESLSALIAAILSSETLDEMINLLADMLKKLRGGHTGDADSIAAQAHRYILEHLYEEGLSLGELSDALHVAPSHLCHLLRMELGEPITQYIMHKRIVKACELLTRERLSVRVAGERVGYPNTQYFVRVFKRVTGMTPGKYREMIDRQGTAVGNVKREFE
jgi:AraC-like DNA-binding protein